MSALYASLATAVLLVFPALVSAQLRFEQPSANLGELRGGPVYPHRFEFVNDSAQPLEITDIRLGCGCLQPVLDKRIYQAGEKGTLVMNVRTLGQPNGARTWQARVQYRVGAMPHEATLIVAAVVRNEVTVEPSIIAATVETTLRQEVTIKDNRATPAKITAVRASSPAICVTTAPMAGGVTRVTLEISRAALTADRQEETLTIYSDDAAYRELQVPITLIKAVRADVTATPAMVEISGAGAQLVRLRASGGRVVRIEGADADQPGIKCTWANGPGNDATLRVSAALAGTMASEAVVRLRLSAPPGAMMTVPIKLRKE